MPIRCRHLVLALVPLVFVALPMTLEATTFIGCYNCVADGGWGPVGPTDYVCESAGNEETGEGIFCMEWEVWFGTQCDTQGGACFNVDVEEPWPPQPD